MMSRLAWFVSVVLLLVGCWALGEAGVWSRAQERTALACGDWLVGSEPVEVGNSFGPLELKMPKTQVPGDKLSYSFTFKHAVWPGMDGVNLYGFERMFIGLFAITARVDTVNHPGQFGFTIDYDAPIPLVSKTVWFDVPADESDIYWGSVTCKIEYSGSSGTKLTRGESIIGNKSNATHSKEVVLSEQWFIPAGTSYTVTIEDVSGSDVTLVDTETALGFSLRGDNIDADDWSDHLVGVKYAMSIDDIKFSGNPIDTSEFAPTTWGGTAASVDKLWVEGYGGNSIGFWASEAFYNGAYVYNTYTGGTINAPFSYDFSQFNFLWMDDTPIPGDVEVYVTGIRRLNSSGIDIGPWHGSIDELKAIGRYTQKHGCYYWSTYEPDMQAVCEMYLDMTSAEQHGIDIRGPKPQYKVEMAGYGQTMDMKTEEIIPGPFDGPYRKHFRYNDEWAYTNDYGVLYLFDKAEGTWALGFGPPTAPFYIQEGGGPAGVYLVNLYDDPSNLNGYKDMLVDAETPEEEDDTESTGQRIFSGWAGYGKGPVVTADQSQTIIVDSDCATPSFAHDATCIWDAHPLSATNRTSEPYMDDIVILTASSGKGIYGEAHTHEDWEVTNGTDVDADGNFTIGTGGGSIELVLKCNYRDRQAKVGGIDEIPVPLAYLIRRHDVLFGQGATPEEREAVWDWRGFYLTQGIRGLDVPVSVTCTIKYYMDLLGCSDNHKTDSTRQTEYSYSPGELFTLTREIPVTYIYPDGAAAGFAPIQIDLYDDKNGGQPIAMAYSIKWDLPEGEYRLNEPTLVRDNGDRQEPSTNEEGYRPAPEGIGLELKVDESSGYRQHVWSAHHNGLCNMMMFVPDNSKAAVIERVFDTLNVLIGAKTGQDLTSCYPLSIIPITNSGELLTWNHSQSAEDAHMVDEDGARLTVLRAYDVAPGMHLQAASDTVVPRVAVRCYSKKCVRGLPYTHYGTKYVGGQGHGMVVRGDDDALRGPWPRKRAGTTGKLYRRPLGSEEDGDYQLVGDGFGVDEHGHWKSSSEAILGTDEDRMIYEYALLQNGEYASMGRFATREFALLQAYLVDGSGELYVVEQMPNLIFILVHRPGNGIELIYTSDPGQYFRDGKSLGTFTNPYQLVEPEATEGSPSGYVSKSGNVYVYHLKDGNLQRLISSPLASRWGGQTTVITGENIIKANTVWHEGRQYCVAVNGDGGMYIYASHTHFEDEAWVLGENKFKIADGISIENMPSFYQAHGKFWVHAVVGEDVKCWTSGNFGRSWTEVD